MFESNSHLTISFFFSLFAICRLSSEATLKQALSLELHDERNRISRATSKGQFPFSFCLNSDLIEIIKTIRTTDKILLFSFTKLLTWHFSLSSLISKIGEPESKSFTEAFNLFVNYFSWALLLMSEQIPSDLLLIKLSYTIQKRKRYKGLIISYSDSHTWVIQVMPPWTPLYDQITAQWVRMKGTGMYIVCSHCSTPCVSHVFLSKLTRQGHT